MLISDRNQGRDSTIDPSYLSLKPRTASVSGTVDEELVEQVNKNKKDIGKLVEDYNKLSQEEQLSKEKISELAAAVDSLFEDQEVQSKRITDNENAIAALQDQIGSLENLEPIPINIINELEFEGYEEGEG